jgi:hypothetical protein
MENNNNLIYGLYMFCMFKILVNQNFRCLMLLPLCTIMLYFLTKNLEISILFSIVITMYTFTCMSIKEGVAPEEAAKEEAVVAAPAGTAAATAAATAPPAPGTAPPAPGTAPPGTALPAPGTAPPAPPGTAPPAPGTAPPAPGTALPAPGTAPPAPPGTAPPAPPAPPGTAPSAPPGTAAEAAEAAAAEAVPSSEQKTSKTNGTRLDTEASQLIVEDAQQEDKLQIIDQERTLLQQQSGKIDSSLVPYGDRAQDAADETLGINQDQKNNL